MPTGPASSVEFDAGWYVAATSTETPDGLEIALDKESYAVGETAKLKVSPRFAGELLVTVGSETLLADADGQRCREGGATIDIPVTADWGAGAYVTATLFRPGDAQESRMPMRAIGIKWLTVDPGRAASSPCRSSTATRRSRASRCRSRSAVTGAAAGEEPTSRLRRSMSASST